MKNADHNKRGNWNLHLPHDNDDPNKRYVMPDPDVRLDAFTEARSRFFGAPPGGNGPVTNEEIARLFTLAEGYLALTTSSHGQTAALRKLRDIWRARRARE